MATTSHNTTIDQPAVSGQSAGAGPRIDPEAVPPLPEELRREFQDLGLSPYEARLLLAMLQLGPANTLQLAQASGVPRTSTYPVLEGLGEKQLAYRIPGEGPAVWACVSREEILSRLDAIEQERLRQHRARSRRVRVMLDDAIPDDPPVARPALRLLHTPAEQHETYQRLAAATRHEALLATHLPPTRTIFGQANGDDEDGQGDLDPVIADLAGRLETRVLFPTGQESTASASPTIAAMHACRDAGGLARTVPEVPLELAIFDRQAVLLTLSPATRAGGAATVALIEHPGVADVLTDAFKYRWFGGAPCGCPDH